MKPLEIILIVMLLFLGVKTFSVTSNSQMSKPLYETIPCQPFEPKRTSRFLPTWRRRTSKRPESAPIVSADMCDSFMFSGKSLASLYDFASIVAKMLPIGLDGSSDPRDSEEVTLPVSSANVTARI